MFLDLRPSSRSGFGESDPRWRSAGGVPGSVRLAGALVAVLLLVSVSCTSWQRVGTPPAVSRSDLAHDRVRVTLMNGVQILGGRPTIVGDSLWWGGDRGARTGVPIGQIAKVEVHRVSATRTAFLVGGIGLLVATIAAGSSNMSLCTFSCPHVYAWDGAGWAFECAPYVGAIVPSAARTDVNVLSRARPEDGVLRLRIAGVPGEREYLDAVRVLTVDHDPGSSVAADPGGRLHALGSLEAPTAARDASGRDALARIRGTDSLTWESLPTGRDPERAGDIRDGIQVEFPKPAHAREARLLVDGGFTEWATYMSSEYLRLQGGHTATRHGSTGQEPERSRAFAAALRRETFLEVLVWDGARWRRQALLPGSGPEHPRRQVVPLDLSGVKGSVLRVRLECAPLFWAIDRVAVEYGPERACVTKRLVASEAQDAEGRDLRRPLLRADGRVHTMEGQDTLDVRFVVGPGPGRLERTYFIEATGWYSPEEPGSGGPDRSQAGRVVREPHGLSRLSVVRLNETLGRMAAAAER